MLHFLSLCVSTILVIFLGHCVGDWVWWGEVQVHYVTSLASQTAETSDWETRRKPPTAHRTESARCTVPVRCYLSSTISLLHSMKFPVSIIKKPSIFSRSGQYYTEWDKIIWSETIDLIFKWDLLRKQNGSFNSLYMLWL